MSNLLDYRKDSVPPVIRSRSLYTQSYHGQTDDPNFQFYDQPPAEAWNGSGAGGGSPPPPPPPPLTASLWRHPRAAKIYPATYYTAEESCLFTQQQQQQQTQGDQEQGEQQGLQLGVVSATPHGTITLRLAHRVRVDMTIDRAVRIINFKNNIVMAMNASGSTCALLHPNGRVHQYGSRVEIMAHDSRGNNKYAKMWYKGVSFTSENCALVYLVDSAGTRTTTDNFSDLSQDFSLSVFYNESRHGAPFTADALSLIQSSQYWISEDGVENWIVNNIRVSQAPDGLVRIARNSNKYNMRTSPTNGTASMTTPFVHSTASMGQTSHLFVRRGERRMHYDGTSFIVRNAGHSAGFDDRTQLKVF